MTVADTMNAEYLCLTRPGTPDHEPSLLALTSQLLDFLRVAQIVDYSPTSYLGSGIGPNNSWKI
jgi:hypothetical protein